MKKRKILVFLSVIPAAYLMAVLAEGCSDDTVYDMGRVLADADRANIGVYSPSLAVTSLVRKLDLSLYQQGSDVFLGDVDISEEVISDKLWKSQFRAISSYKKRLPKTVSIILELKNLEGRLQKEQFKALKYFLDARYLRSNRYYVSG